MKKPKQKRKKNKKGGFLMSYKCAKCGEKIHGLSPGTLRCPSCANKILYKMRDSVGKEIKAR